MENKVKTHPLPLPKRGVARHGVYAKRRFKMIITMVWG